MRATVGDQLVQHGRVVGQHDKVGEIVEVLGHEGNPPYRVRFEDGARRRVLTRPRHRDPSPGHDPTAGQLTQRGGIAGRW